MAILHQMKASSVLSVLMVAAALVILSGHHRAAAQLNCPLAMGVQALNITVVCAAASRSNDLLQNCCGAVRAFNFSCTCSSAIDLPRTPSPVLRRGLTTAARICNITLPQGLNCAGVRT